MRSYGVSVLYQYRLQNDSSFTFLIMFLLLLLVVWVVKYCNIWFWHWLLLSSNRLFLEILYNFIMESDHQYNLQFKIFGIICIYVYWNPKSVGSNTLRWGLRLLSLVQPGSLLSNTVTTVCHKSVRKLLSNQLLPLIIASHQLSRDKGLLNIWKGDVIAFFRIRQLSVIF